MSNVIFFKPRKDCTTSEIPAHSGHSVQNSTPMTICSSEPLTKNHCLKINELEQELLKIIDDYALNDQFTCKVSSDNIDELPEKQLPDFGELEEIVVFSPEIQQEGFAESSADQEEEIPASWGDVFVKIGEEYPFLFTVYTDSYTRNQLLRYAEKISPSSRDIILRKKQLQREDIIRAVIKWVNLYCPSLMGRPISLESDSILQTLVCDPFVEIQCPDSAL